MSLMPQDPQRNLPNLMPIQDAQNAYNQFLQQGQAMAGMYANQPVVTPTPSQAQAGAQAAQNFANTASGLQAKAQVRQPSFGGNVAGSMRQQPQQRRIPGQSRFGQPPRPF